MKRHLLALVLVFFVRILTAQNSPVHVPLVVIAPKLDGSLDDVSWQRHTEKPARPKTLQSVWRMKASDNALTFWVRFSKSKPESRLSFRDFFWKRSSILSNCSGNKIAAYTLSESQLRSDMADRKSVV